MGSMGGSISFFFIKTGQTETQNDIYVQLLLVILVNRGMMIIYFIEGVIKTQNFKFLLVPAHTINLTKCKFLIFINNTRN
jgi:hypothetical protein